MATATYPLSLAPNFSVGVSYNTANGKVSGLEVVNNTGADVYAAAVLTNDSIWGQVWAQGNSSQNVPGNNVQLTFDAQEEPTFVGLKSIVTRIPA